MVNKLSNFLYQNDLPDDLEILGDIAIDTESMGLNVFRDRLCVVQVSNGDGDAYLVHFENNNYTAPNLVKIISNNDTCKIFHYARADMAYIQHWLGCKITSPVYCTRIASKLARTFSESHSLKTLCRHFLDVEISKGQQCSDWGRNNLSKEQINYAASDVLYLHHLKERLHSILKRENKIELAQRIFGFLSCVVDADLKAYDIVSILNHH